MEDGVAAPPEQDADAGEVDDHAEHGQHHDGVRPQRGRRRLVPHGFFLAHWFCLGSLLSLDPFFKASGTFLDGFPPRLPPADFHVWRPICK